jgi:hypothetical protein
MSQSIACSMGAAVSWHATLRPVLLRVIRPASASTSRCFITAGSDILNGSASSLTETPFLFVQPRQQCAPGGIGERAEHAVEGGVS